MYFRAVDKKLLKTYSKIWKTINNLMKNESDSEPVYGDE